MAQAVAEHVLACYRSRDPNCPLEPAREGVVEIEEEAAREAVQGATAEVAACFTREAPLIPDPGSSGEEAPLSSEPDGSNLD